MVSNDESTQRDGAPELPPASARRRAAPRQPRRLRPPSPLFRRVLSFAVMPIALVLATFAVAGPSYSVFSKTASDTGNAWTGGTVVLQNNSSGTNAQTGSALFNVSGLQPGATASKCIAVTSTGTTSSTVTAYVANLSPASGGLPPYITIAMAMGTGSSGTNGDCTGFTQTSVLTAGTHLNAMSTPSATGWAPTGSGSETRIFKITYSVDMNVPNTLQSSTASATFTWEAQS